MKRILFVALAFVALASLSCVAALSALEKPSVYEPYLSIYSDDNNKWAYFEHEGERPFGCPTCDAARRETAIKYEGTILPSQYWLGFLWLTNRGYDVPGVGHCVFKRYSCSRGHAWVTLWKLRG